MENRLLSNLMTKISQIYKGYKDVIETKWEEIEKQRKEFEFDIKILEERILKLKKEKKRPV